MIAIISILLSTVTTWVSTRMIIFWKYHWKHLRATFTTIFWNFLFFFSFDLLQSFSFVLHSIVYWLVLTLAYSVWDLCHTLVFFDSSYFYCNWITIIIFFFFLWSDVIIKHIYSFIEEMPLTESVEIPIFLQFFTVLFYLSKVLYLISIW